MFVLCVQTTGLVGLAVAENPHEVRHVSCVFNGNCQQDEGFRVHISVVGTLSSIKQSQLTIIPK